MRKKLVILLTLVIAFLVVMAFTSISFAALTVSSVDQSKLKATTPATIVPSADQAIIANLVIKGNGPDAVLLEKQTLFKQKNNTGQPVLMIISKKSRALTDDSGNMVVRRENAFKSMSAGYNYMRSVDQHLAVIQEASISGNQMKKPTYLDNGFFL